MSHRSASPQQQEEQPRSVAENIRDDLKRSLEGLLEGSIDSLRDSVPGEVAPREEESAAPGDRKSEPSLTLEPHDDDDDGTLSRYNSVEEPHLDTSDEDDEDESYEKHLAAWQSSRQNSPNSAASTSPAAVSGAAPAAQPYRGLADDSSPDSAQVSPEVYQAIAADAKLKGGQRRRASASSEKRGWDHSPMTSSPSGSGGPRSLGRTHSAVRAVSEESPRSKADMWLDRGPRPGDRIFVADQESPYAGRSGQGGPYGQVVEVLRDMPGNAERKRVGTVTVLLENREGRISDQEPPRVIQIAAIIPAKAAAEQGLQSTVRRPKPGARTSGGGGTPLSAAAARKIADRKAAHREWWVKDLARVVKALRKNTGYRDLPLMTEQEFDELLGARVAAAAAAVGAREKPSYSDTIGSLVFRDFTAWYLTKDGVFSRQITADTLAQALSTAKRDERDKKERAAQDRRERHTDPASRPVSFAQREEESKRLRQELASKTAPEELNKKYQFREAEARRDLHRRERELASQSKSPEVRGVRPTLQGAARAGLMQAAVVQTWGGAVKDAGGGGGGDLSSSPSSAGNQIGGGGGGGGGVSIRFEYDEEHIAAHEGRKKGALLERQTMLAALRKELLAEKPRALRRRAEAAGLPDDTIAHALEARDPKRALIDLLVKRASRMATLPEGRSGSDSSSANAKRHEPEPEPEPEPEVELEPELEGAKPLGAAVWTAEHVAGWLGEIGLGEYGPQFQQQEMDGAALRRLRMLLDQDGGGGGNVRTQGVWRAQVEEACGLRKLGHFMIFWSELTRLRF
jgi:hypothetical protein